ncbi:MAG: PIN domain-containing protein [Treponema sp.]|nr:PIN domain-containing protein [Treponema sp.]
MKILIDTNICLDILQKRPDFYDFSRNALLRASELGCKLYITTVTVMDIMYITRKFFKDNSLQKTAVQEFISAFKLLKISKRNINHAFLSRINDFEDAVQSDCAKSNSVNLILTRNTKDFLNSKVKAISPKDFLTQF